MCLVTLLLITPIASSVYGEVKYTFGVVPQQSATKLARLWTPILNYLNKQTGYNITFNTAPNIPEFERRLSLGEYDFAYMNPYHYTVFHEDPGYQAFAKQKHKSIVGLLVTRKDSPIDDLDSLNNKTLAFPSPAAFAASILPRSNLEKSGIMFFTKYVSSPDSVYRSVALGLYPAGGGIKRTLNNIDQNIRNQLRILWTTAPYTPHAFAVHPRVDNNHLKVVADSLYNLENSDKGKTLLKNINFKGIETATNEDWDDVRSLSIDIIKQH